MRTKTWIDFKVKARQALFTDPISRVGGEKFSYLLPTYEALKGIAKAIYWKPTFIWNIDRVRIMRKFRTESKSIKTIAYQAPGSDLYSYTYVRDVEYQVQAHFEWNMHHPDLAKDRNLSKHLNIAKRMVELGGRQDVFLGTRECQGYVEACEFGEGVSHFDDAGELAFNLTFHGFDYPDETGKSELVARFWKPLMYNGVVDFIQPKDCKVTKFVRPMEGKVYGQHNTTSVELIDDTVEA